MLLLFNFQWSTRLFALSRTAYILYHIPSRLSRGFSKVFQVFSTFFFRSLLANCQDLRFATLFKAARILYHKLLDLSRGFLKVFSRFFKVFFVTHPVVQRSDFSYLFKASPAFPELRCSVLPWYISLSVFFTPYSVFFPFIGFTYISCVILPDSLYIIPQTLDFVKGFFESFFVFLRFMTNNHFFLRIQAFRE